MTMSKYTKLTSNDATRYSSIYTYGSGGRGQQWSKKYGADSRDPGEASEWENTDNFCDIAVNWFIVCICYILVAFSFPFSLVFCLKIISNYETLVIFRLGKLQKTKGPGPTILLPCIDQFHRIDLRMRAFAVPPQTVLLTDGSGVEIGADVYFRTCDPLKATLFVQNLDASIRALAKTTIINAVMPLSLNDLQSDTQVLTSKLQKILNETCCDWGCEIGQVVLSKPKVLQEPREESRHPGFSQLSKFLSGFAGGSGDQQTNAGNGMNAIIRQLAPQLAGEGVTTQAVGDATSVTIPSTSSSIGAAAAIAAPPPKIDSQIEELAQLFLGVLSGILTEKLVRSINCTYEITLENIDISGESLQFYLDLKHGLGSVGKGQLPSRNPDACISLPASRFPKLLKGELSVFHAYMCGDLKVHGDTSAALKLEEIMTLMMNQIGVGKNEN